MCSSGTTANRKFNKNSEIAATVQFTFVPRAVHIDRNENRIKTAKPKKKKKKQKTRIMNHIEIGVVVCVMMFFVSIQCDECADRVCDEIPKHYNELGCKISNDNDACCATRLV